MRVWLYGLVVFLIFNQNHKHIFNRILSIPMREIIYYFCVTFEVLSQHLIQTILSKPGFASFASGLGRVYSSSYTFHFVWFLSVCLL